MLGPHIFGLPPVISSMIFATLKQSARLSSSETLLRKSSTLSLVGLVFASAINASLILSNQRQLDETRVVDPLCCFLVVLGPRPEDALHECLRVAIVKWEPARLDLHHDAVTRQEHVIRCRQFETIFQRLIGCDRFRKLQTLTIT